MWQHTQETNGIVDVPFTLPTERSQDTHTGLIDALATQGTLKRKQRRRKVHALSKKKCVKTQAEEATSGAASQIIKSPHSVLLAWLKKRVLYWVSQKHR